MATCMRVQATGRQGKGGRALVIVHHSVHRLDPLGINVAVEDHPLRLVVLLRGEFAHDLGDDTIVRLLGHGVY